MAIAKQELYAMLDEDELKNTILVVFANKQDLPNAMSAAEITESLGLHGIKNRQWTIFQTSAIKGQGLYEGLDFLVEALKKR